LTDKQGIAAGDCEIGGRERSRLAARLQKRRAAPVDYID
jgi:hypothetical protein